MIDAPRDTTSSPLDECVVSLARGAGAPPGLCLAVSHAGRLATAATGVAQAFGDRGPLSSPVGVDLDTATDLGSVTKILATTGSLLALAAEEPQLLERRLDTILSWTAGQPVAAATVTQLLEHRAGLWEWWPLYLEHDDDPPAALRAAATRALRYRPGEARHYSDLGFMLLGEVVVTLAGSELSGAVAELVTKPAGLHATCYGGPAPGTAVAASSCGDRIEQQMIDSGAPYPVTGDAASFASWREHVLVGEVNDGNAFHAFHSCAGHAGLFSTARDLLRFGDDLLACRRGDDGDPARAALARFMTASADPTQGLGFRRWELTTGPAWGHTGFPGVGFAVLPDLDATVVMVTNRLHVAGAPCATEPMWRAALDAAERHCTTTIEAAP